MAKKQIANPTAKIIIVIALVVIGVGVAIALNNTSGSKTGSPTTQNTRKESDFNPKKDSEQAIRNQSSPTPAPSPATPPSDGSKQVPPTPTPSTGKLKPIITGVDGDSKATATQIMVDALSDGATSGTCTLNLVQNGTTFSVTAPIVQIATYYGCSTLRLDKSKLVAGAATITVSVSSGSASGTSDVRSISVVK